MPSHTASSGLVKLSLLLPTPWDFPDWQKRTGVFHGLFPIDDSDLPPGWTRQDSDEIQSYFTQYENRPGEADKISFAQANKGADHVPGRAKWRKWVNAHWKKWGVHDVVIEELRAAGIYPISLMTQSGMDSWPPSYNFIPQVLPAVGRRLFGNEAMLPGTTQLTVPLTNCVRIFASRTWANLSAVYTKSKKSMGKLEKEAIDSFSALDEDTVTREKLKNVIRAVARWKNVVEVLQVSESLERLAEMESELHRLMEGLGVPQRKTASRASGKHFCKVTAAVLASLAKEEEAEQFAALYNDYFCANDQEVEIPEDESPSIDFGQTFEGADPGVEIELGMKPDDLKTNLGFKANGIPALFNSTRHTSGLTHWVEGKGAPPESELQPLKLHWHQLAGIHSVLRHAFTVQPTDTPRGMLISDGVGLGKTYQAIAVIAFLMDLIAAQERSKKPPPLIETKPFLGRTNTIPNAPHLILVPGTLLPQWVSELQTLFKPKSVDILTYVSGKDARTQFWAPEGPYRSSKHPPGQRIIIATFTALSQDFEMCYDKNPPPGSKYPWDIPRERRDPSDTLLGLQYLTVIVDEAHLYRNHGPRQTAILVLLLLATLRLILTATPLQTSTKDIGAMGRFAGIPFFSSPQALLEEKEDAAALRKAREADPTDQEQPAALQIKAARRLQGQFEGRLLRRSGESLNWEQKALLSLPPCESHHFVLKLTEREERIIEYHRDIAKENTSTANAEGRRLFTRKFYLEYRMAVIFALEHPNDPIPDFKTLEEWRKMRGTKIDACARLCKHFLERDDAPMPTVNDGSIDYPVFSELSEGQVTSRKRKILIFQEFRSMGPLLRQILRLYGVETLYIDGSQSFEKRAAVVTKFKKSGTARVLIISSVGATGLNLTVADTAIFVDQPWSRQDEKQVIGRVHRQPQEKLTTVIHLLGQGSSDVLMSGLASSKGGMMTAFLGGDPEMAHTLRGGCLPHAVDDDDITDPDPPDDDEYVTKAKPRRKAKAKAPHEDALKRKEAKDREKAEKEAEKERVKAEREREREEREREKAEKKAHQKAEKERKQAEKAKTKAEEEAWKSSRKKPKRKPVEDNNMDVDEPQAPCPPPITTSDRVVVPVTSENISLPPPVTTDKAVTPSPEDDLAFPNRYDGFTTEPSDGLLSAFSSEVNFKGIYSGDDDVDARGFDMGRSSGEDIMDARGFDMGMSSGDDIMDARGFDMGMSSRDNSMDPTGFDTDQDGNRSTQSAPASSPIRISPKVLVSPAAGTKRRRAYEIEDTPTKVRNKKSRQPSDDFQFSAPLFDIRAFPRTQRVSPPPAESPPAESPPDQAGSSSVSAVQPPRDTSGTGKYDPFSPGAWRPKRKSSMPTQAVSPLGDDDVFKAFASAQKAAPVHKSHPPRNLFLSHAGTSTRPEPRPRKENPFAPREGRSIAGPSDNGTTSSSSHVQEVGPPPPNPLQTGDRPRKPKPRKRQGDLIM